MSMPTAKTIIELIYGVVADNNLSRILPVLDEHIVLYIAGYGPRTGEYHGRSGFLTMMAGVYQLCENLSVNSLAYFIPEKDRSPEAIIATGVFEGILLADNKSAVLPFLHYWQLKDEKVVELRAFNWASAELISRIRQEKKGPDLPLNGYPNSRDGLGS